ncbi:MAG: hypothetical protein J0H65_09185 [Rhizobiales bacterium]|nr:hypothetical protein [Hyphomicrobiales bacterium]
MADKEPPDLIDFSRCTNQRLFEYARDHEDDAYALTAIRAALSSRTKSGADFARIWIDRRIRELERVNRPRRWYQSRLVQLAVVTLGAVGVSFGQGAGQVVWDFGLRLAGW